MIASNPATIINAALRRYKVTRADLANLWCGQRRPEPVAKARCEIVITLANAGMDEIAIKAESGIPHGVIKKVLQARPVSSCPISADDVMTRACAEHYVTLKELKGSSNGADVATARHAVVFELWKVGMRATRISEMTEFGLSMVDRAIYHINKHGGPKVGETAGPAVEVSGLPPRIEPSAVTAMQYKTLLQAFRAEDTASEERQYIQAFLSARAPDVPDLSLVGSSMGMVLDIRS